MPDSSSQPTPRRSAREKKAAKHHNSLNSSQSSKRKRSDNSDTEAEENNAPDAPSGSEDEDADGDIDEDEDQGDDEPRARRKAKAKSNGKSPTKRKGPPPAKRQKVAKAAPAKKPATKPTRRTKRAVNGGAFDANAVTEETKISADNPLFNAIMNPSAALQSTIDDFLHSLQETPDAAQAELINLILRACGCNDTVDSDLAVDYDGVVDALDNFTEGLKQDNTPVYPLTSRLAVFKKFRKSLSEFIERLIVSSAELGVLYNTDIMSTLQTWVVAMSSSQIRSFRHTATVVALEVETALCDVAAAVEKESEVIGRQRQGEKKRKATNKETGRVREKGLETKAAEVRERRKALAEFIKEFVDGVFVHRYRDLDPNIRAECVHAIGQWFKKYPSHFLDASYLRYVGWVLSDSNAHVRLEAVKSLSSVYSQSEYAGSLNQFTERFKPRLIEMAEGDIELNVRVAVIQVLTAVDGHSLLQDEEREKLCLLVFDEEPKVRKAVSSFVEGVWSDGLEERLVGKKADEDNKAKAGMKEFAVLLVKWSKELDHKVNGGEGAGADEDDEDQETGVSDLDFRQLAAFSSGASQSRIECIVEALWDKVDPISDWEGLLDFLLLDHSASGETDRNGASRSRREGSHDNEDDSVIDEIWRLEEIEEGILLEVLLASLAMAKTTAQHALKKGEEDSVSNDITRALIKGIPRLITKHQTDQHRISHVLRMPPLMNLDLYLEMRLMTAYGSLWDDVSKQFLSHSSKLVLSHAVDAIRHFLEAKSLSNTNNTKVTELEEELSTLLRDAIAGRDELELSTFSEDEVLSITALCSRLAALASARDITAWMEENEGGKQSSAWDIISALAERGRLGHRDEELMVEQAMLLLTLHIMWKAQGITNEAEPSEDQVKYRELLQEQRDMLLEKMLEYCIGTQTNAIDGVKRAAFQNVLNLYILFSPTSDHDDESGAMETAGLTVTLDEQAQFRCAGFVQAQIERYIEDQGEIAVPNGTREDDDDEDDSSNDEADKDKSTQKKAAAVKKVNASKEGLSSSKLQKEYHFMSVIFAFLRALHAEVINSMHGQVLLAQHGRLGPAFNACSKGIIDILRVEGINHQNGELVATVVVQSLTKSFSLFLDGAVDDDEHTLSLAKLLVGCMVVRGAQLSVVARLDGDSVVEIHTSLLTWIGKRLGAYEKNGNKKGRKNAALFFRSIVPLLLGVPSRDALRIKAHLEQVISQSKIEVSATSKVWDSLRAYEKRLGTAISKESRPKKGKGRKGGRTAAAGHTDEESELTAVTDDEAAPLALPITENSRPKPRPRTRAQKETEPDIPELSDDDGVPGHEAADATPKAVRQRPVSTPISSPPPADEEPQLPSSPLLPPSEIDPDPMTPVAGQKRRHPQDDDDAMDVDMAKNGVEHISPSPLSSRATTPANEMPVRRKRVRH